MYELFPLHFFDLVRVAVILKTMVVVLAVESHDCRHATSFQFPNRNFGHATAPRLASNGGIAECEEFVWCYPVHIVNFRCLAGGFGYEPSVDFDADEKAA